MTLPRHQVISGTESELRRFGELIQGLDDGAWAKDTRCAGWTVADVAAHVVGTFSDIANGRFAELGAPDATERQAAERRGRSQKELADELQQSAESTLLLASSFDDDAWAGPAPAGLPGTLGEGAEAIWYDAFVHADDIRAAVGLSSESGPGLLCSVSHLADLLTREEWGPATLVLDGLPEIPVSGGGGRRVTGDPLHFVLVATGRADPATLGLDDTVNVYRPQ